MVKLETFGPKLSADPLEALGEMLAREKLPWRETWGPHGPALFPHVAKDIEGFEARSLAMHSEQEMIELPDKPSEPMRTRRVVELDPSYKAPPPNFEDTEESRQLRGIVRGD